MDPLSITLGVAPLCLAAFKGSRRLKEKFKLIRDFEGEISRFRTRFKTQISVFRDESQLLLQDAGIGYLLAARMLRDFSHAEWTAGIVEQKIQQHMGQKYIEAKEATERIGNHIADIESLFGRLDTEEAGRGKVYLHFMTYQRPRG
ncbi:hypothetical protein MFIFM68171_10207 [Madurella fahalii]|uniref:Uncharacterized protein n=1 Tax=Madurella fahalii TaxID=1157608 RepID=A0ABQ0GQI8_9PEZI